MYKVLGLLLLSSSFTNLDLLSKSNFYNNIYLTAIPKTGSNLLGKCLQLITKKSPGGKLYKSILGNLEEVAKYQYFNEHRPYTNKSHDKLKEYSFKGVFIIRDPRDQIVSFSHHIKKYHKDYLGISELSLSQIIKILIQGKPSKNIYHKFKVDNIGDFYSLFIPWKNSSLFYTTYFEKLIGPKGGATKEEQELEIKNIAKHLGYTLEKKQVKQIANNLFGGTWTFRSGQIGEWKREFTKEHKDLFKKVAGDLLIKLGYEKDYNW